MISEEKKETVLCKTPELKTLPHSEPFEWYQFVSSMEVGSKKLLWSGGRLRRAMEVGSKERDRREIRGWLKCGAMQRP